MLGNSSFPREATSTYENVKDLFDDNDESFEDTVAETPEEDIFHDNKAHIIAPVLFSLQIFFYSPLQIFSSIHIFYPSIQIFSSI